jgi:imidazolonepropionase-like amidohydrolase
VRRSAACASVLAVALGVVAALLWPPRPEARPQGDVILENVVLLTPGRARERGRRLIVREGRIAAIEPTAGPGSAVRFVLPGLIDMHAHLPPRLAPGLVDLVLGLYLAHGVTALREVGSLDGQVFEISAQVERGERRGPRVIGCGVLLDGDPPGLPVARAVRTAEQGEAIVRELAAQGARCVKVYEGVSPEALAGVRHAATELGLAVLGHVTSALPLSELWLDDVQHLCYSRCGAASPEEIEAFVESSESRGVAHTPTLVVFEGQALLASRMMPTEQPFDLMPRFWRESLWRPVGESGHEGALQSMQALVARLYARGVRIHAGTDPIQPFVVPGASLHREVTLLVASGLSIEEALAAATWVAGEALGVPGLGRIEVGAPADLIVLREDPTRDLAALETIEAVVSAGRLYSAESLRAAVDEDRRYFERTAVDLAYRAAARAALELAERSFARAQLEPTQ